MSKRTKEQLEKIQQLKIDYQSAFNTEGGKRVWDDLKKHSSYATPIHPRDNNGKIDVNALLLEEGSRNLFLFIVKRLKG